MSRKSRFWSDKFNDEMYNLKFWLISGVEHLPTIFTGIGGIHQMPWLCSSCVITSNQVKMSLKPRLCIPESAYTQHMATWGQTSRWKWRKSRQLPRNFQILATYLDEQKFCTFHPPVYNDPKLKLSWWVPWLGNNRHNKLPEVMACGTMNTNINMDVFLNTPVQGLRSTLERLAEMELSGQGLITDHLQLPVLSVKAAIRLALSICLLNKMKWLTTQWKLHHNSC